MTKEEYPCGQCGRMVSGHWKIVSKWTTMQWSDTAPVMMRTKQLNCPYCNVTNDVIEIRRRETSKFVKIKKPKNGKQKD